MYSSLSPGGRPIIQDVFFHDREVLYPEEASLFAVSMLFLAEQGNTYSCRETAEWPRGVGYLKIRPITMKKGTEDWDGGLLEAVRRVGK